MSEKLLEVKNLTAAFLFDGKPVPVTKRVSYDVYRGEILGVVGESGSGKSVTAKSVLGLLPNPPCSILEGEILYEGKDILRYRSEELRKIRGNKISMIFQEPMTSLNPIFTCGSQIIEAIMLHQKISKKEAWNQAVKMLREVGVSEAERRMKNYPHELSGGMRQRVMIAMALCCNPELLIADEPTTALDPTIQAQILEMIKNIQEKRGMSVMYITHDLGVVAEICDRVVVIYAGMVMEIADTKSLFQSPLHPYTLGLLHSMPRIDVRRESLYSIKGMVPHVTNMPDGCRFHPRCPYATDKCVAECPELTDVDNNGHMVRCWNYKQLVKRSDAWCPV